MKAILVIGPIPPPITGQSVAFSYLKQLKIPHADIKIVNTQKYRIQGINYLHSIIILPFLIIFSKYGTIYFIGSRSNFGFLRQLPFLCAAIFKKVRLINHLHGADFKDFFSNSKFLKPLIRWVYLHVESSIILLEQMKDQFEDFPQHKLVVVPNTVGKEFENLNIEFPKNKTVLYLSNLMASKGILEFLKAAKQLLKEDKTVTIDIAGAFIGDHLYSKKRIQTAFYQLFDPLKANYPNRIFLHGTVSGQNKLDLLKAASIFVLPTYYPTEAFPIAIVEAMATGNAIVTTAHNYLKYIVSNNNGAIIPIKNEKEIMESVLRLFGDSANLEKIQKMNYKVAKNYRVNAFIKSISNILDND